MNEKEEDKEGVKKVVKKYLLEEFLPGEDPKALEDSMALISSGIIDSIATTKLVLFLEERFDVRFEAHEVTVDYLNSLNDIASTIVEKVGGK